MEGKIKLPLQKTLLGRSLGVLTTNHEQKNLPKSTITIKDNGTHRQTLGAAAVSGPLALVGVGVAAMVGVRGVEAVGVTAGQAVACRVFMSSRGGGDTVQVSIWSRVWSPPEVCCKQITTIIIIIGQRPGRVLPEHPNCP